MNPTASASAYRDLASKMTDEAQHWEGNSKAQLLAWANTLAKAARMTHYKPEIDEVMLDTARDLWIKAQAIRGVGLLARMLQRRSES